MTTPASPDTKDPYRAPKAEVAVAALPGELASRGQRLLNMLIDMVAIYLLALVVGGALGFAIALFDDPDRIDEYTLWLQVAGMLVWFSYYLVLEALSGRTLGKLVTRTKVVRADGGHASFGQLLGRSAARMIPFDALSFLNPSAVGWHDSLSRTRVVRVR